MFPVPTSERGFVPNKQAQNDPSMDYRAQVALRNNFDPISQALVDERPRSAVSVALVASGSLSPYIATSSHEQMRKQVCQLSIFGPRSFWPPDTFYLVRFSCFFVFEAQRVYPLSE
jgi:hypothetical protein